jgi:hypothetical protein
VIGQIDSNIRGTVLGRGSDIDCASGDIAADSCGLEQGQTMPYPAACVESLTLIEIEIANLIDQQIAKIVHMQEVADLFAAASKSDIG